MADMTKNGKVMHYTNGKTIRELVNIANELNIPREDVITILKDNGFYYLVYYYGGE